MRYALIIPDGAADRPHAAFGGGTALQAANIPNMDRLAREGRLGLARTVASGMKPGSDVANLAVLGYDPLTCYTGRAPLEAASLGIELGAGEAVFRANTVTVQDGVMVDYAAGHITSDESQPLIRDLAQNLGVAGATLYPGIQYRHACVIAGAADDVPDRSPPHDIMDEAVADHEPTGRYASALLAVEARSIELLKDCQMNRERLAAGKLPVTQLWLWGGGVMPALETFEHRYGLTGGLISAVDLLKGIGRLTGLEVIEVPGANAYYDTNFQGKGEAALECLSRKKLVVVHVEAPDEAGHNADPENKVKAIENIDQHIVRPLLEEATAAGDLRILCMPDHPTPVELRTHTRDPVPFALWGPGIGASGGEAFTEEQAALVPEAVNAPDLMGLLTRT